MNTPLEQLMKENGRICFTCKSVYTNPKDVEFLDANGECFRCDHIRGEIMADSINVGDDDHMDEVAITNTTTEKKGADIL